MQTLEESSELETGDIILYKNLGNNFFMNLFRRAVQFITNGEYIHGAIYLGEHQDFGPIIAEALASGFLIRAGGDTSGDVFRYRKGLDEQRKQNIINYCLSKSNYQYGYLDLFKILIYRFTRYKLFSETVEKLTCVEVIARTYENIGIELTDKEDLDLTYPSDIANSDKLEKTT